MSDRIDNLFKIKRLTFNWTTSDNKMNITAEDIDGYNFFCWLHINSVGTICLVYTDNILTKNTVVYTDSGVNMNGRAIFCFALYIKK